LGKKKSQLSATEREEAINQVPQANQAQWVLNTAAANLNMANKNNPDPIAA